MISDMLSFIVLSVISFIEDGFDGFSILLVSNAFSRLIIYCLLIAFSVLSFSYLGSKTPIFSFKASFSLIIESSDFPSASIASCNILAYFTHLPAITFAFASGTWFMLPFLSISISGAAAIICLATSCTNV